jgi:hypothetical protein
MAEVLVYAEKKEDARFEQSLRDLQRKAQAKMTEEYEKYRKENKPFCTACAFQAIKTKIEALENTRNIALGEGQKEPEMKLDIDFDEFNKCMEFKNKTPIVEKRILKTIYKGQETATDAMVPVAEYHNYQCKNNPLHHQSIQVELSSEKQEKKK